MPLVSMRQLLDHAAENGYGIPAFNVNNLEQVQAVMTAAHEVGAPVILQASAGARKYAGEAFIKHLIQAAMEAYPHIPLVMHQDHGQTPAICQGAIDLGFGSVMMDGSLQADGKTPASFDYNVEVTRKVVDMAHKVGVTVEGELGCLGNLETGEAGEEDGVGAEGKLDHSQMLTDPEEAAVFVKATQLDALAIAIGTSHGAYKFSRKPTGDILAIGRVLQVLGSSFSKLRGRLGARGRVFGECCQTGPRSFAHPLPTCYAARLVPSSQTLQSEYSHVIATRHRTIDRATASWWGNLALLALLAILLALPFHSHRLLAQGQTSTDEPVVVILRFGDGSERHYTQIRWTDGLTALDALQRAADHPRGFPLQVRGKGKTAFVVSIDGLSNEGDSGKNWIFRVNGTVGEQSAGVVSVSAGGRVEWNFETPP